MSSSSLFASLGAALQALPSSRFSFRIPSPTARSHPVLNGFEAELAAQLDQLKSADDAGYLSMNWLCQAMGVVLSTHASVEAFVPDLQQALADGNSKWLDEYLDDSVKLLDVCNVLKDTVNDIKAYHTFVEMAVHCLERGSLGCAQLLRAKLALSKCTEALKKKDEDLNYQGQRRSKLETCSSMLRRMGEKLNVDDASRGNFFCAIYAAQVTTIFVCGVLVAALSFKARRPLSMLHVAGQSSWAFSLGSLQQRIKEQVDKKKSKGVHALLEETEKADLAVQGLDELVSKLLTAKAFPPTNQHVAEVRQKVEKLRACGKDLKQGLAPLEHHINELFRVLIASRMVLLDIYGHS